MSVKFPILLALITLPCGAQPQRFEDPSTGSAIGGPVLGYVFDSAARTLKVISGVPGAALLETPQQPGFDMAVAAVSPRQDYILAADTAGGVRLLRARGGCCAAQMLDGAVAAPARITLSPAGNSAVLYGSGVVQFVTGLPDAPSAGPVVAVSGLNEPASAMALSDDGEVLLIGTSAGDGGSLLLVRRTGENGTLPVEGPVTALAFRPGSHDALAASASNRVWLIRDTGGNTAYEVVATPEDGIDAPVALAFAGDGGRAFIASSGTGSIAVADLARRTLAFTPCRCTPSALERLNGSAVFRLNEPSDVSLRLFDASAEAPRVWFVPREIASESQESKQ